MWTSLTHLPNRRTYFMNLRASCDNTCCGLVDDHAIAEWALQLPYVNFKENGMELPVIVPQLQ